MNQVWEITEEIILALNIIIIDNHNVYLFYNTCLMCFKKFYLDINVSMNKINIKKYINYIYNLD